MLEEHRFALSDALVETTWGFDLAPAETALASRESRRGAAADEEQQCRQPVLSRRFAYRCSVAK